MGCDILIQFHSRFIILIAMPVLVPCWHFKRISDFLNHWNFFSRHMEAIGTGSKIIDQNSPNFPKWGGGDIWHTTFLGIAVYTSKHSICWLGWNSFEHNIVRYPIKIVFNNVEQYCRINVDDSVHKRQRNIGKTVYIIRHKFCMCSPSFTSGDC